MLCMGIRLWAMSIFIQILFHITSGLSAKIRHALITFADDVKLRGGFIMSCRKNEMNLGRGIG